MQLVDDRLLLSASDLINYLECAHLTRLDLEVECGEIALGETRTDAADLVARKPMRMVHQLRTEALAQMRGGDPLRASAAAGAGSAHASAPLRRPHGFSRSATRARGASGDSVPPVSG
jgi:hypothetical protein